MLVFWIGIFGAEAALYILPVLWRYRRVSSLIIMLTVLASFIGLYGHIDTNLWALLGLLGVFRVINLLRVFAGRGHEQYLRPVTARTSLWLFLFHPALLIIYSMPLFFGSIGLWNLIALLQAVAALTVLTVIVKNTYKLRFQMPQVFLTDRELPTVTVAIPARNETTDLEACLKSILANDYPKLEVLVLDDCSQATTADVIRSFAHNGVRFIKGSEPVERWLAKNQAYQKLYEEATGELLLFCGVDARFSPQAVRSLVNLMAARQKSMVSVLPIRTYSSFASLFIQPMRYWWELALPRRLLNKPAVLSTCWMIGRQDLRALGGFAAVSHSILPERYFARQLIKTDQYSFVRSSSELHIETVKNFHEQYATALRTLYPQLQRKPEWVLPLSLFYSVFLLLPFILTAASPWWHPIRLWLPMLNCLLLSLSHVILVTITDPGNSLLASVTFPFAVITEIYVMYNSMIRYEFFTMEWKDRNICIPVMHVFPKLPELNA